MKRYGLVLLFATETEVDAHLIFFLLIVLCIVFFNLKTAKPGSYFEDYCAPENTKSINAIFTLLIFLSHAKMQLDLSGPLDEPYLAFRQYVGQFVVVTFLFYSGFGIMESIRSKGRIYVLAIPKNRLFRVWYHFALAVLLFTALRLVLGDPPTFQNWLLSMVAVENMGNSSWFIFVILALYLLAFLAFLPFKKHLLAGVGLMFVLTGAFVGLEIAMGKGEYYYNTIFLFPAGMLFSFVKPAIDRLLRRSDLFWYLAFASVFAVYYYFSSNRGDSPVHHTLWCLCGMGLVLLFTMKVQIQNSILLWVGDHVFSIYMLMLLPMLILNHFGFTDHKYSYVIISFIATVMLAVFFDTITAWLDRLVFKTRKKVPAAQTTDE